MRAPRPSRTASAGASASGSASGSASVPASVPVPWPPVEPPPTAWVFGPAARWDPEEDVVGLGADLEPGTLLTAYRSGLFPMPLGGSSLVRADPMGWWSPVRRGVLELDDLVVSRSLRRACRDVEIRVDSAFEEVVEACADPRRTGSWIDRRIKHAYARLHRLGWAHSVEAWCDGELTGGLYGLGVGGLFAGESMFHRERDASKVALVGLVDLLRKAGDGPRLIDVQWSTPHLASLGVTELSRTAYLDRLPGLLAVPSPRLESRPPRQE